MSAGPSAASSGIVPGTPEFTLFVPACETAIPQFKAHETFGMTEPLHFMMGQFKAQIPQDRFYSPRHLWLKEIETGRYRVGFTAYSLRLLQDIYFLEWSIDPESIVRDKQEIGEIESAKAVSSMFPPFAGKVVAFNPRLLSDPSGINADNYGNGWLYDFETVQTPLSAAGYIEFLNSAWDDAQKTIKGQVNES